MKFHPLLAILLVIVQPIHAHFARPESVPVERLVETVSATVAKDPDNAEAQFTLGRIHYLAFVTAAKELDAYPARDDRKLPTVGPHIHLSTADSGNIYTEARKRALAELKLTSEPKYDSPEYRTYLDRGKKIDDALEKSGWCSPGLPAAEGSAHLAKALSAFRAAMTLQPKNALYQLGYASLVEQASDWTKRHPDAVVPDEIRQAKRSDLLNNFKKAWEMELGADMKNKDRGALSVMDMVSYEAGTAYVRLAKRDEASLTAAEKAALGTIEESLIQLAEGRARAITPLILSQRSVTSIDTLLAPDASVAFPLRGWGPDGRWSWLKPDTALLIWNPSRSGKVASGAQLFGGYTWELFWKNGYEPLAVLDSDGDGILRGDELAGISLWFDRNSNGVADPGEVQTLAEAGITALATRPTAQDGIHPMNPQGVTFSDGRVLPTWDWMAAPAGK